MIIAGIDIGYSNLKVAYGHNTAREPVVHIRPSGAALLEESRLGFGKGLRGTPVLVDGKPWIAGHTQQGLINSSERSLDREYTHTNEYRALFHLALLSTGSDHIDRVVTGLPVSQCLEPGRMQALRDMLVGSHEVADGMCITVGDVLVGPQPGGSLVLASRRDDLRPIIEKGFVSIFDPGFFSTDWLTVDAGRIVESLCGTNMRAVSVILDRAAEIIRQAEGSRPTLESLEEAVRTDSPNILVGGKEYDYRPMLKTAARDVGIRSVREIAQNLRVEARHLDMVIVTGGGADIYRPVLETILPNTRIVTLTQAVLGNALGFWWGGR